MHGAPPPTASQGGFPLMPGSRRKVREDDLISELAKIGGRAARGRFLGCHPRLARREIVGKLAPMVAEKARVDTREALHLAEAALLIARRLRWKEGRALALRAKGNAPHASARTGEAAEHHDQACKLFESLGPCKETARTLSSAIQPPISSASMIAPSRPPNGPARSLRASASRRVSPESTTTSETSCTARIALRKPWPAMSEPTRYFQSTNSGNG